MRPAFGDLRHCAACCLSLFSAALQPAGEWQRYCPVPSPFYPIAAEAEAQFQLSFPSRTAAINSALAPFYLLPQAQNALLQKGNKRAAETERKSRQ